MALAIGSQTMAFFLAYGFGYRKPNHGLLFGLWLWLFGCQTMAFFLAYGFGYSVAKP